MARTDPTSRPIQGGNAYLVGGGIASLAAAAFLIRDGDVPECDITIIEESGLLGGSFLLHG